MSEISQLGLRNWLSENGYRYSCFVSWPNRSSEKVRRIVETLKKVIEGDALDSGLPAHVFISDEVRIGTDWAGELSSALCASLTLVAICGPEYYASSWCGREWAGMRLLGTRRLGQEHIPIVPLILKPWPSGATAGLRQLETLPPLVKELQCLDLSRTLLRDAAPEDSAEFEEIASATVLKVAEVALSLWQRGSRASCEGFEIPERSAFEEYQDLPVIRRYPFLTEP